MIRGRALFALPMTKWLPVAMAVSLVCGAAQAAPRQLDELAGFEDLCAHSASWLTRPADATSDAYRRARDARTRAVYVVDVTSRTVGGISYEEGSQLLTPVHRGAYPVLDGSYAVRLRGDPLLGFELDQDAAQSVKLEWAAGNAAVRLYFVLDAYADPFAPYCRVVGAGTEVRGVLLAAHLIEAGGQSSFAVPGEEVQLGSVSGKEGHMLVQLLALDRPEPSQVPHRMWAGKVSGLKCDIPEARLAAYREQVEQLMVPCHLAALVAGGPRSGSLVVVTQFGKDGVAVQIPVEVTGFPALGECSVRVLARLRPDADDIGATAKFVLYFEPLE